MKRRLATTLLCLALVTMPAAGCVVDTGVPDDARLSCDADEDCPRGWTCGEDDLCLPPGYEEDASDGDQDLTEDEEAPWREEEKRQDCDAIYTKTTSCASEALAMLGATTYGVFEQGQSSFQDLCALTLLAGASDQDLDDLALNLQFVNLATCAQFVPELCALFPADSGYATNCPAPTTTKP